jgi:hypothetical protein
VSVFLVTLPPLGRDRYLQFDIGQTEGGKGAQNGQVKGKMQVFAGPPAFTGLFSA